MFIVSSMPSRLPDFLTNVQGTTDARASFGPACENLDNLLAIIQVGPIAVRLKVFSHVVAIASNWRLFLDGPGLASVRKEKRLGRPSQRGD